MSKLRDILNRVLTSNSTADSSWLAVLKIGAGVALIARIISESRYIELLYSSDGFVPLSISRFSQNPLIPSVQGIYQAAGGLLTESHFLFAFFLCQLLFALFLLLGLMSRFSAFVCWAMQVVVFNSTHLTSYGFDAVLLSLLFYSMIFSLMPKPSKGGLNAGIGWLLKPPSGGLGASAAMPNNTMIPIYQKVIQLHICLIYLANGISKVSGHTWQDGSGMWDAINQPQFQSYLTPLLQRLLMINHIPALVTWSTLIIEIGYPFLIWLRGINRTALCLIIVLHLFIALVFGLWLFAFVMIVFNLAAFGCILFKPQESS